MRKFLTMLLALAMLVTMAVPAFAADHSAYNDPNMYPNQFFGGFDGENYTFHGTDNLYKGNLNGHIYKNETEIPVLYDINGLNGNEEDFDSWGKGDADENPSYRVTVQWDTYAGEYTPAVKYVWDTEKFMYKAVEDTSSTSGATNVPAAVYVKLANYSNADVYYGFEYTSAEEEKTLIKDYVLNGAIKSSINGSTGQLFNTQMSLSNLKNTYQEYLCSMAPSEANLNQATTNSAASAKGWVRVNLLEAYTEGTEVQVGTLKVTIDGAV